MDAALDIGQATNQHGTRSWRRRFAWSLMIAVAAMALAAPRTGGATSADALAPEARALLVDVERIVDAEEASGWFLDEEAYSSVRSTMLESVCRTPPLARSSALDSLAVSAAAAGEPRVLYERRGRELTADVERALTLDRSLRVLTRAVASAEHDCPFWAEPSVEFRGLQTAQERIVLSLEGGGNAQVRRTDGDWTLGGGGLGRALVGYGIGPRLTLLAGAEFGGGAMLEPNSEQRNVVLNYFSALPMIVRVHRLAWHYDVELAPVGLFQSSNSAWSFGTRGGLSIGLSALRARGVLPWAGASLSYEYYFAGGGREAAQFLRGGLRVGFLWDP